MNNNILQSIPFWSGFIGVTFAQLIKPFINMIATKEFNPKFFLANGGMPSSHTSGICALTVSIGLTRGFASDMFVVCFAVALIIMNDAMNVRLETGKQAQLLNEWSEILEGMFSEEAFTRQNFKTMVGHTTVQVFWGMVLGVIVGICTYYVMA